MYSSLPKVLHKIAGQSMLSRVINTAQSLTPQNIIVVYGHGAELVQAQIKQEVIWAEQKEQLGTGHALKMALPHLSQEGKTLVLYGDVPLIGTQTLQTLLTLSQDGIALLTDTLANPTGLGRIIRANDQILGIVEEKDATEEQKKIQEINTGIMVIPNQHIDAWLGQLQNNNAQKEFYLTDIIALATKNNVPVYGLSVHHSDEATGVNNKQQLAMLERSYQKQQALYLLEKGVTLLDANRFDLRGTLTHGQDVTIDVNVVFEGENSLGNNISIGANCVLKNVTIADNVIIEPFSHLENCIIKQHSKVGPFARLRTGTELSENTHIGNFVEVKNSQIGQNSKVNHLSYIGDTSIGQSTNIGAGTITCNYDGVNKFKTKIGDHVFVGSGTMLVAPVTVENGATIGAGSVITKICLSDKLTLARSPQVTIDSWLRPQKATKE
ncbi:bifunctional UDP-N-acetylglucosamine diphosphorylase/glucosamine-1-phosphate N-acetyltransferase GlmU [Neisseria sp. Ec49-e6-T10]|uniref:bifunctional UDP-N-acetylglucosamine diphosphorylase/glucosamine-1-phosphate N-acetyltransferase GlmU n=1 Tax=Neisseria sp. Ec49-e6-T10 TaxID=3140744 RepID=UPI003EBC1535